MGKLFERLVQRRLQFLAESGDWIPRYQFGFRRSRSALNCVASVTVDILRGFGDGEPTLAFAVVIKEAADGDEPRVTGVGVLQGGVPSPLLFNLDLRMLEDYLPEG